MADYNLFKGHNIQIAGKPSNYVIDDNSTEYVSLNPSEFRGVKPKLLVKEGDDVKTGSPLFCDKSNPQITWPSPGTGKVSEIVFGERRSIQKIVIKLSEEEVSQSFSSYSPDEINDLSRKEALSALLKGNIFPFIRQRPFNKVSDPETVPRDIFISGWNTAPLSVNLDLALRRRLSQFQAGIDILKKLTNGDVHLSYNENTVSDTLLDVKGVKAHTFNGPHPAGNVGIQIHHISPLKLNDVIWTVNAQDVVRIGNFFLTGQLDTTLFVTVGGPSIKDPIHIKSRLGSQIEYLLKDKIIEGNNRVISGDILTGIESALDDFIGFYHSTISVLPNGGEREFLGMLRPGSSSSRYSLTNAFVGSKQKNYRFNTLQNGSERYILPINTWEDVLPMDILPNALYRAINIKDIEEMEQLGIIECDEEDFALCSFACPSKIDVGGMIRDGLDLMEEEG
ncbi:MAG: NADH:ubiquinone reductase (Na(+)-transporting) subunit A [Candidatus Marinimicrobia bacterium]|nr:NADH:ubiquinone reductase (Na(+)-transporting) subunit A [Candidatus Neomarinimicrobiota bacterium]